MIPSYKAIIFLNRVRDLLGVRLEDYTSLVITIAPDYVGFSYRDSCNKTLHYFEVFPERLHFKDYLEALDIPPNTELVRLNFKVDQLIKMEIFSNVSEAQLETFGQYFESILGDTAEKA